MEIKAVFAGCWYGTTNYLCVELGADLHNPATLYVWDTGKYINKINTYNETKTNNRGERGHRQLRVVPVPVPAKKILQRIK